MPVAPPVMRTLFPPISKPSSAPNFCALVYTSDVKVATIHKLLYCIQSEELSQRSSVALECEVSLLGSMYGGWYVHTTAVILIILKNQKPYLPNRGSSGEIGDG